VRGTRFWCRPASNEEYAAAERRGDRKASICRQLRHRYADQIRATYPGIPHRVSGYDLDSLLPEHGFDVAGQLVGSESTLVIVLRAELKLVDVLPERSLVVLGYPSADRAADAVPRILDCERQLVALEGLDHRLITDEQLKRMNSQALRELPEGTAYLMVQFGGRTRDEVDQSAEEMLAALHDTGARA
jgi:FAD/FMN-containing dehydrogenase